MPLLPLDGVVTSARDIAYQKASSTINRLLRQVRWHKGGMQQPCNLETAHASLLTSTGVHTISTGTLGCRVPSSRHHHPGCARHKVYSTKCSTRW